MLPVLYCIRISEYPLCTRTPAQSSGCVILSPNQSSISWVDDVPVISSHSTIKISQASVFILNVKYVCVSTTEPEITRFEEYGLDALQ
jgi:hypothetical protein